MKVIHPFAPIIDKDCKILILGSFPSVKSRENHFYYGHPQNRFWKVLASLLNCELPKTNEEKKAFLLTHHIAVWDILKSCDIEGSADASIQNAVLNDIKNAIKNTAVHALCFNGSTAYRIYLKYLRDKPDLPVILLPSSSPANAQYRLDRLCDAWSKRLESILFS